MKSSRVTASGILTDFKEEQSSKTLLPNFLIPFERTAVSSAEQPANVSFSSRFSPSDRTADFSAVHF